MTTYSMNALAGLVARQIAYGAYLGPDATNLIGAELQALDIEPTTADIEAADRALCAKQVDGTRPPRIPEIIRAIRSQTIQSTAVNVPAELAGLLTQFPETRHQAIKREYFSTVKAGWTKKEAINEIRANHSQRNLDPIPSEYSYQTHLGQ